MAMLKSLGPLLSAVLACCSGTAVAETAVAAKNLHLRAGPGRAYPVVAIIAAGMPIEVEGCLQDYSWCDVAAEDQRGWVYAGNILYRYEDQDVPVIGYGPALGIGISAFIILDYWSDHYRDRPWYRDRYRWAHPPRSGPVPPGHPPGHRPEPLPGPRPQPHPGMPVPPPHHGEPSPHPGGPGPVPRPPQPPRERPAPHPPERGIPPPPSGAGRQAAPAPGEILH